jgi:hypothetical protein
VLSLLALLYFRYADRAERRADAVGACDDGTDAGKARFGGAGAARARYIRCQYLYFCARKASKGVSICTLVLVKQVNCKASKLSG